MICLPTSFRVTSLALGKSSACEVTLKDIGKIYLLINELIGAW